MSLQWSYSMPCWHTKNNLQDLFVFWHLCHYLKWKKKQVKEQVDKFKLLKAKDLVYTSWFCKEFLWILYFLVMRCICIHVNVYRLSVFFIWSTSGRWRERNCIIICTCSIKWLIFRAFFMIFSHGWVCSLQSNVPNKWTALCKQCVILKEST